MSLYCSHLSLTSVVVGLVKITELATCCAFSYD